MATLFQATLNTTQEDNAIQLESQAGTGWSTSASGITLTPTADTNTPAIYVFQINAPSGYNYTGGGSGFTWGTSGNATYGIITYTSQAYLVAIDDVTTSTTSSSFALTVTATQKGLGGSRPLVLDPTVSFNPPG